MPFVFQILLLVRYFEGSIQPSTPLATLYLNNGTWATKIWAIQLWWGKQTIELEEGNAHCRPNVEPPLHMLSLWRISANDETKTFATFIIEKTIDTYHNNNAGLATSETDTA